MQHQPHPSVDRAYFIKLLTPDRQEWRVGRARLRAWRGCGAFAGFEESRELLGSVPGVEGDAAELDEEGPAALRVRRGLRPAARAIVAAWGRGRKVEQRELGRVGGSHVLNVRHVDTGEERRTMS